MQSGAEQHLASSESTRPASGPCWRQVWSESGTEPPWGRLSEELKACWRMSGPPPDLHQLRTGPLRATLSEMRVAEGWRALGVLRRTTQRQQDAWKNVAEAHQQAELVPEQWRQQPEATVVGRLWGAGRRPVKSAEALCAWAREAGQDPRSERSYSHVEVKGAPQSPSSRSPADDEGGSDGRPLQRKGVRRLRSLQQGR